MLAAPAPRELLDVAAENAARLALLELLLSFADVAPAAFVLYTGRGSNSLDRVRPPSALAKAPAGASAWASRPFTAFKKCGLTPTNTLRQLDEALELYRAET